MKAPREDSQSQASKTDVDGYSDGDGADNDGYSDDDVVDDENDYEEMIVYSYVSGATGSSCSTLGHMASTSSC